MCPCTSPTSSFHFPPTLSTQSELWVTQEGSSRQDELHKVMQTLSHHFLTAKNKKRKKCAGLTRWCKPEPPAGWAGTPLPPSCSSPAPGGESHTRRRSRRGRWWFGSSSSLTADPQGLCFSSLAYKNSQEILFSFVLHLCPLPPLMNNLLYSSCEVLKSKDFLLPSYSLSLSLALRLSSSSLSLSALGRSVISLLPFCVTWPFLCISWLFSGDIISAETSVEIYC